MIFTIFKKELKDTLRDRRTLMMMIVIPVLLFPVILSVFMKFSSSLSEDAATKALKIGYIGDVNNSILSSIENLPKEYGIKEFIKYTDSLELKKAVKNDSVQVGVVTNATVDNDLKANKEIKVDFYVDRTEVGIYERVDIIAEVITVQQRNIKMQKLALKKGDISPVNHEVHNVASNMEMIGKLAGGMLPYIFIAFAFLGCMYPAIDLFTGEKERGTMETLLTTPVPRWKILIGKMGVVVCSGLLASTCALLGLYFAIEVLHVVDNPMILEVIHNILSVKLIVMLYGLLLPMVIFFAGIMIPIAIYAKAFKEAQSIITPLNFVVIMPAMVGFFPGVELNAITSCMPIVNVVLATKELIAGTLNPFYLIISFVVMTGLAAIAVFVSYRKFDSETNVIA